jgi:hypothetical protein
MSESNKVVYVRDKKDLLGHGFYGGQASWKTRHHIMTSLFDLGRLMLHEPNAFKAYQGEIERICNKAYDEFFNNFRAFPDRSEAELMDQFFASFDGTGNDELWPHGIQDYRSLYADLVLLMRLMYGEEPIHQKRIEDYLFRVRRIIRLELDKAYKPIVDKT